MIRGCNKRVIVMKNTGHDMIEEAFFILKADAVKGKGSFADGDILKQANLILDEGGYDRPFSGIKLNVNNKRARKVWMTPFLWGVVMGITVTCILAVFAV